MLLARRRSNDGVMRLSLMNIMSLLPAIAIICSLRTAVAQKPVIKGGEFCEGYLLKKVAKERAEGSRMVLLKAFNAGAETSPDLKKWPETRNGKKRVAVELNYKEKKAFILGSFNLGAKGIASNFQNWHIRFGGRSVEFLSLSEDPKLIFWDRGGLLNYYVVSYGDEFLKDRDWDNVTLDLLQYRINPEGETRLISGEWDVR